MTMGSTYVLRILSAGVLTLALGACATKSDIRDLQDELRSLALRQDSLLTELRREARSTQDTLRTQSDQLFDFRGDINRRLSGIEESLVRLEELVGQNQRGIVAVRDEMYALRRMSLQGPRPPQGDPTLTGGQAPTVAEAGDAEAIYNAGIEQFNRGSLATARQAFRQFLEAYPNHELAPNAHFYLADILVQEGRLEDALDAFREIGELFPTSAKVPDALYRTALIQIDMGNLDEARAVLERIENTYPDSAAAMLARDKLAEIR